VLEDVVEEGNAFTPPHLVDLTVEEGALLFSLYACPAVLKVVGLRVEERVSVMRRFSRRRACETPRIKRACAGCAKSFLVAVGDVEGDEYGVCIEVMKIGGESEELLEEAAHFLY
jgi:hypothetical protein